LSVMDSATEAAAGRIALETSERSAADPWVTGSVGVLVTASACITVGILWDISWHLTIGRDTFWTPAHLMIYLGGVLAGLVASGLLWRATVPPAAEAHEAPLASIRILGLRAPLGAWVAAWGGSAMLISAPLDDWWHNAYGLDVRILSPPHALLAAGMYGVAVGAVLLAAAARNRSTDGRSGPRAAWVVAAMGIQLTLASVLLTELSFPNLQHTARFHLVSAAFYPAFLMAAARMAPVSWPATRVALVYTGLLAAMIWILPLFPAEPGLAPVLNRVTRMVPPAFPLLLLVPAIALDGLHLATRRWNSGAAWTLRIAAAAMLFVGTFSPAQWHFSRYLIHPAADNALVAGHGRFLGYMARRDAGQEVFWRGDQDPVSTKTWVRAFGFACLSGALGSAVGAFLSRVQR
ncbi:MAG: hypothetical protein KIT22_19065, partial [Verrucomicrobiae bacterium]|nr:hypothetical protein [Verrucomicrobiae bacterium]